MTRPRVPCCDLCGARLDGDPVATFGFVAHETCLVRWQDLWLPSDRGTPAEWSARCPDIHPGSRGDGHIVYKATA